MTRGVDRRYRMQSEHCPTHSRCRADSLLAVKDNQATLHADIESYFAFSSCQRSQPLRHPRQGIRQIRNSNRFGLPFVGWYTSAWPYPGAPRFLKLLTIGMVESCIERGEKSRANGDPTPAHGSSRPNLRRSRASYWAIENNLLAVLARPSPENLGIASARAWVSAPSRRRVCSPAPSSAPRSADRWHHPRRGDRRQFGDLPGRLEDRRPAGLSLDVVNLAVARSARHAHRAAP
jgi:hypothetical protein